jgi:pimeloyl-ACP methyl ester carboxylesterase
VTERVVQFGPHRALVGILSTPSEFRPGAPGSARARPAMLLWNVGINHRVGPFRINVDLARRLNEQGFVSLRFDASGLGDSETRRDAVPVSDTEREQLDVRDAMDLVSKATQIDRFVLVGFCSGVDAAHRVAVADPRVVGVIHLESYAYRTPGFQLRKPLRVLSKRRWERYLTHKITTWLPTVVGQPLRADAEQVFLREYPRWDAFTAELESLVDRGVRMLFAYVGGDTDYNHEPQFWEMFPSERLKPDTVDVVYYPKADHVFFGVEARNAVLERIVEWMKSRFPAAPSSTQKAAQPTRDSTAPAGL